MATYRSALPQLDGALLLTDGGLETTLVFHDGLDLPQFAAFDLLKDDGGTERLRRYYDLYATIAREHGLGLLLESPTWRASTVWAHALGYTLDALDARNREAIALMAAVRDDNAGAIDPIVISGCIGPQDDGYHPTTLLTADAAAGYHARQVEVFAQTEADLVTATTMTYTAEAIGITRAARAVGLPAVISFTVETDGRLPSGQPLGAAITEVDRATDAGPAYYMVNCAHPTHFVSVLDTGAEWCARIGGLRANASRRSHAELDGSDVLDDGDPEKFGREHAALLHLVPSLSVLGGCCGTDERHVRAIASVWTAAVAAGASGS